MPIDLSVDDLVRQLQRVGLRPSERLAQNIVAQGEAAVEPLLALARDTESLHGDEPGCWGPIHALRLLGELRPVGMVVPLLELLPVTRESTDDRATLVWAQEVPQLVGRIGEPALEPLKAFFADASRTTVARGAAAHALAYAAANDPELRPMVAAWLREQLAAATETDLAGYLVLVLSQFGVPESYGEIMAAYREGRVSREIITPANARQWLLAKVEKRLGCVAHPLWERYDEHGPFTKEQYAMAEEYDDRDDF